MKHLRLLPFLVIFIAGCRGCSDNAEKEKIRTDTTDIKTDSGQQVPVITDTNATQPGSIPESSAPEKTPSTGPAEPKEKSTRRDPGILSKIDQYLVSSPKFNTGANGGVSQVSITVRNTLSNATIQNAVMEVAILNADNTVVSTSFHNIVNLEPGESKQVTIPDSPKRIKDICAYS